MAAAHRRAEAAAKHGGGVLQPGTREYNEYVLTGDFPRLSAEAQTLEELAPKLEGVDAQAFLRTVREFNAACRSDTPFNPNILDGRRTQGLAIDKTNWANPLDTPPFHAYHVTTGVTFTFGGVKISSSG